MPVVNYDHSISDEVFVIRDGAIINATICQFTYSVYESSDNVTIEDPEYIVLSNDDKTYTVPAEDVYSDVDVALGVLRDVLVPTP